MFILYYQSSKEFLELYTILSQWYWGNITFPPNNQAKAIL